MGLLDQPLDPLHAPSPFGPDALRQAISADLNAQVDIPEGHHGATVWFLNQDKIEVAVAARVVGADGGHVTWDVEGVVSHPWTGGRTGFGVLNRVTW